MASQYVTCYMLPSEERRAWGLGVHSDHTEPGFEDPANVDSQARGTQHPHPHPHPQPAAGSRESGARSSLFAASAPALSAHIK
jgi:hypothetical protein